MRHYLIILSFLILVPQSALSASSGSGSWYRVEGGATISGDFGSMDETKSGTKYENSLYGYSVGGFFRTGLRFTSVSLGISGAVDVMKGSVGRRAAGTTGSNPSYDYEMLQGLAGGFVGITLWGDANGPEIFGEYYIAHRSVAKNDVETTGGPFRSYDAMNGSGWGAGLSFVVKADTRAGLMYRNLVFDKLNLSGTADPVTRSDLQAHQALLFMSSRL